jgi:hypothetical protein
MGEGPKLFFFDFRDFCRPCDLSEKTISSGIEKLPGEHGGAAGRWGLVGSSGFPQAKAG